MAESGELLDFAEHPLVVNEPNTPLPLLLDGLCLPGNVEAGEVFTLTAYVLGESLQPLTDASTRVTATLYHTPTLAYSTTLTLSPEPDGFFRRTLTLLQSVPFGTYDMKWSSSPPGPDTMRPEPGRLSP